METLIVGVVAAGLSLGAVVAGAFLAMDHEQPPTGQIVGVCLFLFGLAAYWFLHEHVARAVAAAIDDWRAARWPEIVEDDQEMADFQRRWREIWEQPQPLPAFTASLPAFTPLAELSSIVPAWRRYAPVAGAAVLGVLACVYRLRTRRRR